MIVESRVVGGGIELKIWEERRLRNGGTVSICQNAARRRRTRALLERVSEGGKELGRRKHLSR